MGGAHAARPGESRVGTAVEIPITAQAMGRTCSLHLPAHGRQPRPATGRAQQRASAAPAGTTNARPPRSPPPDPSTPDPHGPVPGLGLSRGRARIEDVGVKRAGAGRKVGGGELGPGQGGSHEVTVVLGEEFGGGERAAPRSRRPGRGGVCGVGPAGHHHGLHARGRSPGYGSSDSSRCLLIGGQRMRDQTLRSHARRNRPAPEPRGLVQDASSRDVRGGRNAPDHRPTSAFHTGVHLARSPGRRPTQRPGLPEFQRALAGEIGDRVINAARRSASCPPAGHGVTQSACLVGNPRNLLPRPGQLFHPRR